MEAYRPGERASGRDVSVYRPKTLYYKTVINLIDLLILGLAAFRLSSLFANEHGPFDLFGRVRRWAVARYDKQSREVPTTELSRGLMCVWCNSVWFGIALALIYMLWQPVIWLCLPFAISSIAISIFTFVDVK